MRAALLVCVLLAGCAAPPAQAPDEPVAVLAAPTTLAPCDIIELQVDVPAETAAPHVPRGFAPIVTDGMTSVVLGGASCAQGSRAFLAIAVVPEDERLAAPGVRHFFEPEHDVVAGEAFALALLAARGNATNATRIETSAAPPQPTLVVALGEGEHRIAGVGVAVAPADIVEGVFREWYAAQGGYGYLEASFGVEDAGLAVTLGQAETAPGTLAREVIGAQAQGATVVLAGSAYADATLGFVPFP